jgi:hypothetical protein
VEFVSVPPVLNMIMQWMCLWIESWLWVTCNNS